MAINSLHLAVNHIAGTPWGHLQIVGEDENGSLFELEVQIGTNWNVFGDGTRQHDTTTNTPGYGDPLEYSITEIDLGGRSANDVWNLLIDISDSIDDYIIPYGPLTNSNTYAATMLNAVGINVFDYIDQITPSTVSSFPGLSGNDAAHRPNQELAFDVSGADGDDIINGGIWDDAISGGAGADEIKGDVGNDFIAGGQASTGKIGRAHV